MIDDRVGICRLLYSHVLGMGGVGGVIRFDSVDDGKLCVRSTGNGGVCLSCCTIGKSVSVVCDTWLMLSLSG